jgi:hypothetical protein
VHTLSVAEVVLGQGQYSGKFFAFCTPFMLCMQG